MCATIVCTLGISGHAGHWIIAGEDYWLLLSFGNFQGTMKACPQEGGLDPLGPVSTVYGVFSNRDLPLTSGRQPRTTIAFRVWGASCKGVYGREGGRRMLFDFEDSYSKVFSRRAF